MNRGHNGVFKVVPIRRRWVITSYYVAPHTVYEPQRPLWRASLLALGCEAVVNQSIHSYR